MTIQNNFCRGVGTLVSHSDTDTATRRRFCCGRDQARHTNDSEKVTLLQIASYHIQSTIHAQNTVQQSLKIGVHYVYTFICPTS